MRCPKCGNEQTENVVCTACGIYFAKYQAAQERKAAPVRVVTKLSAGGQSPVERRPWIPVTLAAACTLTVVGLLWGQNAERQAEKLTATTAKQAKEEEMATYGPAGAPKTTKPVSVTAASGKTGDYSDPLLRGADARVISAYHELRQHTDWQPEQGVSDAELAHIRARAFALSGPAIPPDDQLDQAIADTERDLEVVRGQMKQIIEGPIKQTKYFTPRYGDRISVEGALEGRLATLMDRKRVVSPTPEMIAKDKQAAGYLEGRLRNQEFERQQQRNRDLQNQYRSDPRNRLGHSHSPY